MPFPNFPHPSLATLNLSHPIFSTVVLTTACSVGSDSLWSQVSLSSTISRTSNMIPSIESMMPSNRPILFPPFPGRSQESCSLMHRAWNMSIVSGSQELSRRLVSELVQDSEGDWEPGTWASGRRWNEMRVVPSPAGFLSLGPRQGSLQVVGDTPQAWLFLLGLALSRHSVPY